MRALDAVCLSGGPDIDPTAYGAKPHAELGPVETDLDAFELAVARAGRRASACRCSASAAAASRSTSRAAGRSSSTSPTSSAARSRTGRPSRAGSPPTTCGSQPRLAPGRRRSARDALAVNSFHHQAVERLGDGLRAVAWSPDGAIEGIEGDGRDAWCSACSGTPRRSTTVDDRQRAAVPRVRRACRRARPRRSAEPMCGFGARGASGRARPTATRSRACTRRWPPAGPTATGVGSTGTPASSTGGWRSSTCPSSARSRCATSARPRGRLQRLHLQPPRAARASSSGSATRSAPRRTPR